MNGMLAVVVVVVVVVVFYGGHDTLESHCIRMKLYRRPRGHEWDVNVEPEHWKYRPYLQLTGSA